jgi:hypothetical protein
MTFHDNFSGGGRSIIASTDECAVGGKKGQRGSVIFLPHAPATRRLETARPLFGHEPPARIEFALLAYLEVFWTTRRWIRGERGLDVEKKAA